MRLLLDFLLGLGLLRLIRLFRLFRLLRLLGTLLFEKGPDVSLTDHLFKPFVFLALPLLLNNRCEHFRVVHSAFSDIFSNWIMYDELFNILLLLRCFNHLFSLVATILTFLSNFVS